MASNRRACRTGGCRTGGLDPAVGEPEVAASGRAAVAADPTTPIWPVGGPARSVRRLTGPVAGWAEPCAVRVLRRARGVGRRGGVGAGPRARRPTLRVRRTRRGAPVRPRARRAAAVRSRADRRRSRGGRGCRGGDRGGTGRRGVGRGDGRQRACGDARDLARASGGLLGLPEVTSGQHLSLARDDRQCARVDRLPGGRASGGTATQEEQRGDQHHQRADDDARPQPRRRHDAGPGDRERRGGVAGGRDEQAPPPRLGGPDHLGGAVAGLLGEPHVRVGRVRGDDRLVVGRRPARRGRGGGRTRRALAFVDEARTGSLTRWARPWLTRRQRRCCSDPRSARRWGSCWASRWAPQACPLPSRARPTTRVRSPGCTRPHRASRRRRSPVRSPGPRALPRAR